MASGDTLCVFTPEANQPPTSNYATFDQRNARLCLDFDASVDESAVFAGVMPRTYSGGGITVTLWIAHSLATSGTSRWTAEIEAPIDDLVALGGDSFAAAQSASCTADGTPGVASTAVISFTDGSQMDNCGAGDPFRIRITRDADGTTGTDNATGDAELYWLEIKET